MQTTTGEGGKKKRRFGGRFVPTAVTLTPKMLEQLALAAELEGVSRSQLMRRALAALLRVKEPITRLPTE